MAAKTAILELLCVVKGYLSADGAPFILLKDKYLVDRKVLSRRTSTRNQ
jgi:hypothetical protein